MRIALIADVHSNVAALSAVLEAIRKHRPDRIISLGDQVNLGPCPRETLELLRSENVTCLHGNHERYILSVMAGRPGYEGANFNALRYNAARLTPEEITFPETLQIGHITFCHAMPGDDRFPVFDEEQALPRLRAMAFDRPTHIICGHGHNPTHIRLGNLTLDSIGSAGCMDDGAPGTAPYAILTAEDGMSFIRPYYTAYDAQRLPELYRKSGMAEYCPVMAHITCLQMMHNKDYLLQFLAVANGLCKARGETQISTEIWQETDRLFPWPDGVSTAAFWK